MGRKIYIFLLSVFILSACSIDSSNDKAVELQVTTGTILDGTVSTSSSNVTGNGDTGFSDRFLTPVSFTAAIKSAKLIKEGDSSASYTIFDQETITNPVVASVIKGSKTNVGGNASSPSAATYDRVQLEVSFLEMKLPNCLGLLGFFSCKLRYYLSSMDDLVLKVTVAQGDILMEDDSLSPGSPYLNWLNRESNQLDPFNFVSTLIPSAARFLPATPSFINFRSQITPHQVPISQFPASASDPMILTINLDSPLTITASPSGQKKIVLNFDLKGLLFFDDTNSNTAFDPWGADCLATAINCDGRLNSMSILGKSSADFYPGIPKISATVE